MKCQCKLTTDERYALNDMMDGVREYGADFPEDVPTLMAEIVYSMYMSVCICPQEPMYA